jgi:hypothetical protein
MKSMTMKTWDIWHAMSANAHLKGTFTIVNPGPGDEYKMRNMPYIEDGEWHKCEAGTDPVPKQLASCYYRHDNINAGIGFRFEWLCKDKQPSYVSDT